MPEVKTEKYLLYSLQVLKNMQDDMETLTSHDAKADPEVLGDILDEIISRCLVPALQQLGIEDPIDEIMTEAIDPSDILEAELERITDELDDEDYEEEEEEEEEEALAGARRKR
ncbi:hypothetical protein KF707_21260 [Candidatus Obscuribacterales bacterium]|jgi:hypothetical protein|nr:hypothetical protein [Candidatus Obscuribacterales bacterium]MBX3138772.1 hypothetical protein [Candidatus Obscuribacterales bacterium]MBX3151252.1 hypothetical protein [Candidatus Obscuribacterales bacterium]